MRLDALIETVGRGPTKASHEEAARTVAARVMVAFVDLVMVSVFLSTRGYSALSFTTATGIYDLYE